MCGAGRHRGSKVTQISLKPRRLGNYGFDFRGWIFWKEQTNALVWTDITIRQKKTGRMNAIFELFCRLDFCQI